MGLSEIDRNLLDRCLNKKTRAWEDFVDRFMGLVLHVIRHTAQARSLRLSPEDRDDLSAEVFLAIIRNDFAVLRNFRGQSSLATYLTVAARRIVVRELLSRGPGTRLAAPAQHPPETIPDPHLADKQMLDREEVEQLLGTLPDNEALVVRMFHLEGKTYQEIGALVGMPENSIGPVLSRAREKLRRGRVKSPVG